MILGMYLDAPVPPVLNIPGAGVYGATVAKSEFLKAILTHGAFKEYHFFVSSAQIQEVEKNIHGIVANISDIESKIKVKLLKTLPTAFAQNEPLVFHNLHPILHKLSYLRNRFSKKAFVITGLVHSISYATMIPQFFLSMLEGTLPCDSIVCPSQAAQQVLKKLLDAISETSRRQYNVNISYNGRLDVIPFGIDTDRFCPRDKIDARRQMEFPLDKLLLLSVARFSVCDKMDLFPLLTSFKEVLNQVDDPIALVLAGEDTRYGYSEKVKQFAKNLGILNQIIFLTNFDSTLKPLLYSSADIFVSISDSIQESFGLAIIEAMASSLPVIASDWNGYRDAVVPSKTGFLVPTYWCPCDEEISSLAPFSSWEIDHLYLGQSVSVESRKLTEYMLQLVRNKTLRYEMGSSARQRVLEHYAWKKVIRRYEALCVELDQQARKMPPFTKQSDSLFCPSYYNIFQHYATATVRDDARLRVTSYGQHAFKTRSDVGLYDEMKELINLEIVGFILSLLSKIKNGLQVQELFRILQKQYGMKNQNPLKYHILWMLKHNLLEFSDSDREDIKDA